MKIKKPTLILEKVDLYNIKEALIYRQKEDPSYTKDCFNDLIKNLDNVLDDEMKLIYDPSSDT